jgi:penicillin-binding protein 2
VESRQGEVYDEELIDERQRKHAWFIAFAPVEAPKIALAVLIENGGGGSEFAAPVARQIIDYYLLEGHAGIDLKLATRGDR